VIVGRTARVSWIGALGLASLVLACSTTTDMIGADPLAVTAGAGAAAGATGLGGAGGFSGAAGLAGGAGSSAVPPRMLMPLTGPDMYPNPLHDEFSPPLATDVIDKRVEDTFQQLFHGDPDTQAIYYTTADGCADPSLADNEACIRDILHDDTRSEGMSLGMLIAVELDHREEFDRLWNYAKRVVRYSTGPNTGYFRSFCDTSSGSMGCVDPYGLEMFLMSLIFAHDRWPVADIDYGADALDIVDVMLHKQDPDDNSDVTNTFDDETQLAFDVPSVSAASRTRPSILMPAFYELWTQATGNPFFKEAATSARVLFVAAADETTGLLPLRSYFDGTAVPGSDTFTPEAYRVLQNILLDDLWTTDKQTTAQKELNRVLGFFASQGLTKYGTEYQLDGTVVQTMHEPALVFVNGMAAIKSSVDQRMDFMNAVWAAKTPTGTPRYYQGIMQLFALLVLSGKMQVY
jgi:oligosaccharide reducing-end xylanase